jgi:hypothetical protein
MPPNKTQQPETQDFMKKGNTRIEDDELNQSLLKSSELNENRKKGSTSNSKQANFNDWI